MSNHPANSRNLTAKPYVAYGGRRYHVIGGQDAATKIPECSKMFHETVGWALGFCILAPITVSIIGLFTQNRYILFSVASSAIMFSGYLVGSCVTVPPPLTATKQYALYGELAEVGASNITQT